MSDKIKIPLYLSPDDYSPAACDARYTLHLQMMQLNPRGFRQYTTCAHRRVQRKRPEKPNRLQRLAKIAYGIKP